MRTHRFDPDDVQFADALVTSVIVIFRKGGESADAIEFTSGGSILRPRHRRKVAAGSLDPDIKWGRLFGDKEQPTAAERPGLTLGDLFFVKRGLATGANDFFILTREEAAARKLPRKFLRPILPSPRHIGGSVIHRGAGGFPKNLPKLVLLDCCLSREEIADRYPVLDAYLGEGERQRIPERYLPRHRTPWYRQEERPPAPILCTYMGRERGRRAIRFLRNYSDATAANVYLVLYPKPTLVRAVDADPEIIDTVLKALEEVSDNVTSGGRVYGGGLNKVEPRELQAIGLPDWLHSALGWY
jgi:adenine-specific DNA-methyltransferase